MILKIITYIFGGALCIGFLVFSIWVLWLGLKSALAKIVPADITKKDNN